MGGGGGGEGGVEGGDEWVGGRARDGVCPGGTEVAAGDGDSEFAAYGGLWGVLGGGGEDLGEELGTGGGGCPYVGGVCLYI